MEAVSQPVYLFDAFGKVAAMSPGAEALAAAGVHLRLRDRRLAATRDKDNRRLVDALARASQPAVRGVGRRHTTVALSHIDGAEPLIVEVAPFPAETGALGFAPRCMAIVRRPNNSEDRAVQLARDFYGLTQAEAEVAVAIAHGLTLSDVARMRGVSSGTTRNQVKSLFQKLGVKRQLELARKIEPFLR
jgi:DNA-binding CsgD family transcriptional regulator